MTILRVILVLILTFSISKNTFSENVVIKFKIENEIITNYDIKQEINYLTAFNNKLKNLPKKKITAIATNSIIQEKIKLIHLINIFNVDEENDELNLMATYLKQEKEEKEAITLSPKILNNTAVAQYKRGNLEQSYTTFAQAFRVMPKNPSIALNYLQAIVRARKANAPMLPDTLSAIKKCRETLESAALSEDQYSRYEDVKSILKSE